jgi:hypothetical protein
MPDLHSKETVMTARSRVLRRHRRATAAVVAAVALLLSAGMSGGTASQAATSADPMEFGIFAGNTKASSVQSLENAVGRPYAYIRVYRSWDDTFPDTDVNWMESTGHSLFLSVKARLKNGTNVSYQQIADAQPGSALYANMVRWATAIKGYDRPIYVSFNHEPDTSNSQRSGTATQFIAAYRKFVNVMRDENVTNARFAYTTAVRNYSVSPTSAKYAPKYYPGDAWIDVIAVDAYNMYCRKTNGSFANPWRSLSALLAPFMTFVADHPGPDLVLAEWGSPEDPANAQRKAQWIADAQAMFKQPAYARFVAISYWNQLSHNYDNCDFKVTSSTSSLNAFKAMANDPFYAGAVT